METTKLKAKFTKALAESHKIPEKYIVQLVDGGLFSDKMMRYYLIYLEFPKLCQTMSISEAQVHLAERYEFHWRYIPQIIERVKTDILCSTPMAC
jgi:hypothetical protein